MSGYKGPPTYDDDIPLGRAEAEVAEQQRQRFGPKLLFQPLPGPPIDGVEYGVPATDDREGIVGYGDPRHEYSKLQARGTENLRPFPDGGEGCSGEQVRERIPCYPHCRVSQRGLRVFSLWGDRTGGTAGNLLRRETPPVWQDYLLVESPLTPDQGSELWSIDVWGYEVRRIVEAGAGPVQPVAAGEIVKIGGAAPIFFPGNAASMLKVRIQWAASSGGETRVLDVAEGIRVSVEACYVSVAILYPQPGTITLDTNPPPALAPNGGLVLDTVVGVQIVPTDSTPGNQLGTNTITVQVLAGVADQPIFIPPGTRFVTIYQSSEGTTFVPTWVTGRSTTALGSVIGQVDLGGARRAEHLSRPGNAGMILSGPADPDFDRWATFIFELEI